MAVTLSSMLRKMRLMADMVASLVRAIRSAPTCPGVLWATADRSTPGPRVSLRQSTPRILALAASSGMPRQISRSKRPALLSAGSRESGRFVAPMTRTSAGRSRCERSSMLDSSCATMRRSISRCAVSRFGVTASISSMKKMHGALLTALSNSSRIRSSDSPDTPATISGAATLIIGISSSPAMACARSVLPQPGGPCSRKPLGGTTPSFL
uniref:Putative conserved protein with signal anchor n=1 Tax=Ixodes ricinus TaxID=34613 RepID=A0A6B0V1U8_IXORI